MRHATRPPVWRSRLARPLGITLVRMGLLDEEALVRTLARQLKLPIAWLRGKWVEQDVLDLVPVELALKHRCLPLTVSDDGRGKALHLAMQDPVRSRLAVRQWPRGQSLKSLMRMP